MAELPRDGNLPGLFICYAVAAVVMSFCQLLNRFIYSCYLWAKSLLTPVAFGATGVVFDAEGRALLVRHGYRTGWHLPGGGIDAGEAPEAALKRELSEEVGLTGGAFTLVGIYTVKVGWVTNAVVFYRVEGARVNFRPSLEVREILWVDPALPPPGISPAAARRLAELRTGQASPFW